MEGLKVALSSDWHGDWQTLGVSRFEEVSAAVQESVDTAIREKVDYYIFTGDLADPTGDGWMFKAINLAGDVIRRLNESSIRCIFLAGNHDVCTDGTGATTLTPLRHWQKKLEIEIVEAPKRISLKEDFDLLCLPFTPPSHAYEPSKWARFERHGRKLIVAGHLTIPGIHPGSETTDMPRGREILFPLAETTDAVFRCNGHYHQRQDFDPGDGGPLIHIPGSLVRFGFGEEDNRPAFSIIEF